MIGSFDGKLDANDKNDVVIGALFFKKGQEQESGPSSHLQRISIETRPTKIEYFNYIVYLRMATLQYHVAYYGLWLFFCIGIVSRALKL